MYGLMQSEAILRQAQLGLVRQGIGIAVLPGEKLTIMQGDIVRMTVAFDYRGVGITCNLRCSIGQRILGIFDEIAYGPIPPTPLTLAESVDFIPYTFAVDIDTSPLSPGSDYDIEAKIEEYAAQTLVGIDNVIDVIGAPEFLNFAITSYEIAPA